MISWKKHSQRLRDKLTDRMPIARSLFTEDKKLRFELYNFGNKSTNSFYMNSYIKIFVNDDNLYDWEIYQYFNDENNSITERETGHSDYRNSIYINNFLMNSNSENHFKLHK